MSPERDPQEASPPATPSVDPVKTAPEGTVPAAVPAPPATPSADPVKTGPKGTVRPAGNTSQPETSPSVIEIEDSASEAAQSELFEDEPSSRLEKLKLLIFGKPKDLEDRSILRHLSLVAFLAWVGLGADGLSSSCYGPSEAFRNLGEHTYLAVFLALATIGTVFLISACYSHIIEEFPSGGGGYVVASKLLGPRVGVVSGCALLVDYVLTITVSIAAMGDALFGLFPVWGVWKLPVESVAILALILLNLRGVKESVLVLLPIFFIFLITHALMIVGTVCLRLPAVGHVARDVGQGLTQGLQNPELGIVGMLMLFLYAYSLGAGTYTGIEAVSNSLPVLREPRVKTGKRTMLYMAVSLAFTAGGLVLCYLLLEIQPSADKTMNQLLTEGFVSKMGFEGFWQGKAWIFVTIISEGALLIVAAQAGFIGGPATLANMSRDSWVPTWFGSLSERLTTHKGVLLMGLSALAALVYTGGNVSVLVTMYAINVFLTFLLSMLGMCRHWAAQRGKNPLWPRRLALFVCGAVLCFFILLNTIIQKFTEGAWVTVAVTSLCVGLCYLIRRHYRTVLAKLRELDELLGHLPTQENPVSTPLDPSKPTAVVLVGGYNGLGMHTLLNSIRLVPGYFHNMVFISVGIVDSGNFKGASAVDDLRRHTYSSLCQYVELTRKLGMPSVSFMAVGTDAVDELERLCGAVSRKFPKVIFFAGQLVFQQDTWYQRLLHNETAFALQRRLQWAGMPMVILPMRVK